VWLFDCGEATQHQVQKSDVKMGKIKKVFVTHTHGDHLFGIGPLLAGCLNGMGGMVEGIEDKRLRAEAIQELDPIEIYGPIGTRAYIRSVLLYTHTRLEGRYVVHELRFPKDPPNGDFTSLPPHRCELEGRNILQSFDAGSSSKYGIWNDIHVDDLVTVSAAPILHSVACVGYVVNEAPLPEKMNPSEYVPHIKRNKAPMSFLQRIQRGENITLEDGTVLKGVGKRPGRKIAILGDTYDPSPITSLAEGANLLVHEATNAYLPGIDPNAHEDDTEDGVEKRTKSRGHSTPQMAGRFAKRIGAGRLALNHFSARYKGDDDTNEESKAIMDGIRGLAEKEFGGEVVCARDLMTISVPRIK